MGWTVNKLGGLPVGGSCRVVSWSCRWSTVFEGFWYRFLGPTVLVVSGTVGWQVKVEGQGRVPLDTGRKQPPEKQKTDGSDSGRSLWFVLCRCDGERQNKK